MRKMIDAYKDGIIQGMNIYMYELPEKRRKLIYIPDNKDNTYVIKTASSLPEAFPKPISFAYMKWPNYDYITEKLIRFASKGFDTFPEKKMPEEYFKPGNYIDVICEKLKKAGKEDFSETVNLYESREEERCTNELIKLAEENNLQLQKPFYINKFIETLNKAPEISKIYSNLTADEKNNYVEKCFLKLYLEADSYIDITMKEAFERMIEDSEAFSEIDEEYEEESDMEMDY
jgi:hypothetical protein